MRRLLAALLAALLLPVCPAGALPGCTTADEVMHLLLMPVAAEDGSILPRPCAQGMIRYVGQSPRKDPLFCADYWLGGEPGSELDLTATRDASGDEYEFHCGNMCTRAAYSMALSFLGVDCTPGDMSAMTGLRSIDEPYDNVSLLVGVEPVLHRTYIFQRMYESYTTDPAHYSPVYVYLEKPSGVRHALLIVARQEDGRYLVVDPVVHPMEDGDVYVYNIRLDPACRSVVNSTFRREYQGSRILGYYQWYKE